VIDTLKNTDDEQDFPWQAQLLLYVSLLKRKTHLYLLK